MNQPRRPRRAVLLTAALLLAACQDTSTPFQPAGHQPPAAIGLPGLPGLSTSRYIVVFTDAVTDPVGLAQTLVATYNGSLLHTYTAALKGFAATLPDVAVPLLQLEPLVSYVEPDQTIRADGTEDMDANGDPWGSTGAISRRSPSPPRTPIRRMAPACPPTSSTPAA